MMRSAVARASRPHLNCGWSARTTHMRIRVLLFASVRDAAGADALDLDAASVHDVARQISSRFPAAARLLERSRFAVNQQFAGPETRLNEGDEVAVIPPVSGG